MVNLDLALARIARIQLLVEAWQRNGSISGIERKLTLDQLSILYDELSFYNESIVPSSVEHNDEPSTVKEQLVEPVEQPPMDDEPEIVAEPEVVVAPKTKVEEVEKKEVEKKSTSKKVEDKPQEPVSTAKGKVDKRLGEQLNSSRKSLFESFGARDNDKAAQLSAIKDLSRAIGINDRFLFTKELFNGNPELFEQTIGTLNQCEDIEAAFMHIHQNFQWSDDNPVVKQLVLLLRRRFKQ